MDNFTFEEWVEELNIVFRKNGYEDGKNNKYTDKSGLKEFRKMYKEGIMPDEAAEQEMASWTE